MRQQRAATRVAQQATRLALPRTEPAPDPIPIEAYRKDADGWETWIFSGDEQQPYGDERAIALAAKIMDGLKRTLTGYCNLGDLLDFYQLSAFDKNPLRSLRRDEITDLIDRLTQRIQETPDDVPDIDIQQELMDLALNREIQRAHGTLKTYRAALGGKVAMHITQGNHEHRLTTYLQRNAPALLGLRLPGERDPVLTVKRLLGLDALGIVSHYDHMRETTWEIMPGHRVGHFDIARKGSAMTAKALVTDRGVNVIQAHTHRSGTVWKTFQTGRQLYGVENPSLCQRYLGYSPAPDWQQGLTLLRLNREHNVAFPTSIPFLEVGSSLTAWVDGRLYVA